MNKNRILKTLVSKFENFSSKSAFAELLSSIDIGLPGHFIPANKVNTKSTVKNLVKTKFVLVFYPTLWKEDNQH